ncbi:MAG: AraC family transcriptional regulator [Chitinophagaceae bacterium]
MSDKKSIQALNKAVGLSCTTDSTNPIRFISRITEPGASFISSTHVFIYVCEGVLDFKYGDQQFSVGPEAFACFKRNLHISYRTSSASQPAACLVFSLDRNILLEFAQLTSFTRSYIESTSILHSASSCQKLTVFIQALKEIYLADGEIPDHISYIKILELLSCLVLYQPAVADQMYDLHDQFRPDICRIVEENLLQQTTMRELSRLAGRSISSFRRDFEAIYNMPPSRWIRLRRLEKAHELLTGTNMTITEICYSMGFESVAHFSRIFKSRFGRSPSVARSCEYKPSQC